MSSLLHQIERRLEPFAIQNLTLYLVIAQTFVYLAWVLKRIDPMQLVYFPVLFLAGDWWRVVSFVVLPPGDGIFTVFALYLFYLYGNALDQHLGTIRYNLFLLTGYVLTILLAFLSPHAPATNLFLGGAVFLAFAFLNPDFVLHLFFILPVKIKWLALIAWVGYGWAFVMGGASARLGVLAATGNFLLFFGRDIVVRLRTGRRAVKQQVQRARQREEEAAPMHVCAVCQRDSNDEPDLGYRYRTEGDKEVCYCEDHLPARD